LINNGYIFCKSKNCNIAIGIICGAKTYALVHISTQRATKYVDNLYREISLSGTPVIKTGNKNRSVAVLT
jgi:hypothetical protein